MAARPKGQFVTRLRRLREQRVLSQQDLSARSGVAITTISELEGRKRRAYPTTIRKLAEALGVRPERLVDPPAPEEPAGG
jgi:transcriptional regulator with XRE-family HTH domain